MFVWNFRKAHEINRRYQNIFRQESIMNLTIEMNEKSRKLDMEIEKVYKTALHRTHSHASLKQQHRKFLFTHFSEAVFSRAGNENLTLTLFYF